MVVVFCSQDVGLFPIHVEPQVSARGASQAWLSVSYPLRRHDIEKACRSLGQISKGSSHHYFSTQHAVRVVVVVICSCRSIQSALLTMLNFFDSWVISCRCFEKRAGSVGINLTQANRVFLLEPAMNPAVEAQAIGRVYRLGQTRNVEIVRLVMKDSVEERLMTLNQKKYGLSGKVATSSSSTTDAASSSSSSSSDAVVKAAASNGVILGSIKTDKAAIMTEEFDFLFQADDSSLLPNEKMDFQVVAPDNVNSDTMTTSGCI